MTLTGFVGLGDQGAPMGERVLASGRPLAFFARRPEVIAHFAGLGAQPCESLHDLGKVSDVVLVCVVDDAQVRDVVLGGNILSGMRQGGVIVIHSTVHPDTCRDIAAEAAKAGVFVLDAPVTGGGSIGARQGTLSVLVGGDKDIFARCAPIFETYGTPRLMGPLGSGQLAKLINNYLFAVQASAAYDAACLGEQLGLDLAQLAEVLPRGSCTGWVMNRYAWSRFSHLVPPHEKGPKHSLGVFSKDIRIMREVLADRRIDARVAEVAVTRTLELLSQGGHLVFDDEVSQEEYAGRVRSKLAEAGPALRSSGG
jgi:3-hydroxyisobutyrate dehydrogenase-like beta-hydroxyacid dehydrogenase